MKLKNALLLLITLTFSASALAETFYINDEKKLVWTRTGPSNQFKVLYRLVPGEIVTTLKKSEDSNYVQAKDAKNRVFWIDSGYLTSKPTTKHRLIAAQRKIESLEANYNTKVMALESSVNELSPLKTINQDLQAKLAKQEMDLSQSMQKARMYADGFNSEAFFAGGITVLAGFILGWLVAKIGAKKRHSNWN